MSESDSPVSVILREMCADLSERHAGISLDEQRLRERIAVLEHAVRAYRSPAFIHSKLEERLRRVEQHLKLPLSESH
jgi:hypothetical protein